MKAVVARGPRSFAFADVAEPDPAIGGRVLSMEAVGVCAADRMLWNGTGPWQVRWPFVPGHEILGSDLISGERLTVEVSVPCGCCTYCRDGRTNLCPGGRHLGSDLPGGFAEKIALPGEARVHRVPDSLPRAAAVLAEPMACALHAVRRAKVTAADTVAVIGLGTVGTLAAHIARKRPVNRVLAFVRSSYKAELARRLGAEAVLIPGAPDRPGVARAEDFDAQADVVIECSGDPMAPELALKAAAPGGRVCLYSVYPVPSTVNLNHISEFKELTVVGGHLAPGCFPEAISMLSTLPAELHATEVRLAEFEKALAAPTGPGVKMALVP